MEEGALWPLPFALTFFLSRSSIFLVFTLFT